MDQDISSGFSCGVERPGTGTLRGAGKLLRLAFLALVTSLFWLPAPASADVPDFGSCPDVSSGDPLVFDFTNGICAINGGGTTDNFNDDYIAVTPNSTTGEANFFLNDAADDPLSFSASVNGGAPLSSGPQNIDCASGCTVSWSRPDDSPSSGSFTFTYNGTGNGSVGSADTAPPVVQSIAPTSSPAAGDASVTFRVTFDENANNVSTDDFSLTTTGSAGGSISAVSASSGTTIDVTVSSITGTGTIRVDLDASTNIIDDSGNGNGNNGTVAAFNSGTAHIVDRDAPSGYSVSVNQDPVTAANEAAVSFTFAGAEVGATYNYSIASSGGGTNVTGSGTISTATDTITGINVSGLGDGTLTLSVTLTDTSGNAGSAATDTAAKDTTGPVVSSVSVPSNATYITGQNLDFTVNFDEAVTVTGSPQIALTIGSTTRQAGFTGGSGTSALTFRYTVQSGDNDSDGIAVGALSNGGGTLRDAAGNDVNLTLNSVGATSGVLVDAAGPVVSSVSVPSNATYSSGQNLDFTVNFDEAVTVTGSPQIALTIGSTTRQAGFTGGSGSSALTFRYTVQSGDNDSDGIAVGALSNGGGTLRDAAGNDANLALNSVGATTGVLVDNAAPNGYSVSLNQDPVTPVNEAAVSFTFAGAEVGATYSYSIASSGGGTNVTGSGTISTATDTITGINVSGLGDGTLTLSVTLTDTSGNAGSAATASAAKDTVAPSGYSVSLNQDPITSANETAVSFTFAGAEVGATYNYSIASSGGGTNVTGSGTIATATETISGLDLSGLGDGTITLSASLTDTNSNAGSAVTDTATKSFVGPPASITVSSGNSQSAEVGSSFANGLAVLVQDVSSNPVENATVTFTAPGSGASLDSTSQTATTNASGIATLSATANSTAGSYTVSASVPGVGTTADFSLTNIGLPEITVVSSESGSLTDGGTDTVQIQATGGTASTITYTISNTGGGTLNLTAPTAASDETNVSVSGFSLQDTSLEAGQSTTLTVTFTLAVSGAFDFGFVLPNNDADEGPFNITVSGTAVVASQFEITSGSNQSAEVNTQFAAPLVATVTDEDGNGVSGVEVTFTAPSTGASLVFESTGTNTETVTTGEGGRATSSTMTANGEASEIVGGKPATYTVTASAAGVREGVFLLANDRGSDADIKRTQEVIASFVTNRANQIVQGQPDLVRRLNGPFGQQSGLNSFAYDVTSARQSGSFEFSLRAFTNHLTQQRAEDTSAALAPVSPDRFAVFDNFSDAAPLAFGPGATDADTGPVFSATNDETAASSKSEPRSGFDFWAQGSFAITDNNNSESQTGMVFAGVDYRHKDRALFGILGQLDITDETNKAAGTSADGIGWMAGPYTVIRLHQQLYFDGRATYGQSYNSVNPLGLYEDDFETSRYLLQAGLTGDFTLGPATVNPFAKLTYYFEEQKSYTDTLGRLIPSQDFDLGRLELGPKFSFEFLTDDGLLFTPFISLSGIYDFNKLQDATPTDATLASSDEDFRGRLEGGAGLRIPGRNISVVGEGFFDGIGTADYRSYGGTLNVRVPF